MCFFCFLLYIEFWLCDWYGEMKKCQCYLIYDKVNGDVVLRMGDSL